MSDLKSRVQESIVGVTPGLVLRAYVGEKKKIDLGVGDVFPLYDLASLTKVISTTSLLIRQVQDHKIRIETRIEDLFPWAPPSVSLQSLLNHTAGFPWWLPIHKDIPLELALREKDLWLKKFLKSLPVESREKAVYSDVDFWWLGLALEQVANQPLNVQFEELAELMGLKSTAFHENNEPRGNRSKYAPTENCPWRGRILQGEVHDENAWALGGIAGHAGLFGSLDDVCRWGLEIRKGWLGESRIFSKTVTKEFTTRSLPASIGDWAYGFMMPSAGGSSSGRYFSPESIGHTGFTGTSYWFDPKKDFMVVILSNRVHPSRTNEKFRALRPLLHDWCFEACFGG